MAAIGQNSYLDTIWTYSSDYFVVYKATCGSIGVISDENLRCEIHACFVGMASAILAAVEKNNKLLGDLEIAELDPEQKARKVQLLRHLEGNLAILKEWDPQICAMAPRLINSLRTSIGSESR